MKSNQMRARSALGPYLSCPGIRGKENILRAVGVRVEHGEGLRYGESRGAYKTVGDEEHVEIINAYIEGASMSLISKIKDRARIHYREKAIRI